GRVIQKFWEDPWDPGLIFSDMDEPRIFAQGRRPGEWDIVVPYLYENRVTVQRPVTQDAVLEVMRPDGDKLQTHLDNLKEWMLDTFRIPVARVVAGLGITCASRYRNQARTSWNHRDAMQHVRERYPNAAYVGCFMDGEVGI